MMERISGVYKITNKITGEFYIGSSTDIKRRWTGHKSSNTWNSCSSRLLYKAFQEYGLENFDFEIIEKTDNLHEREQYFIDLLKPTYNKNAAYTGMTAEKYQKQYQKQYSKTEKGKESQKKYLNKLCEYNGRILTLNALCQRFRRAGVEHPAIEAKKYIIS